MIFKVQRYLHNSFKSQKVNGLPLLQKVSGMKYQKAKSGQNNNNLYLFSNYLFD